MSSSVPGRVPPRTASSRGSRAAAVSPSSSSQPSDPAPLPGEPRLTIGIVGFGTFGQFLARRLVSRGHEVLATSRTDHTEAARQLGVTYYQDANDFCECHPDVVVLATSILSLESVLRSLPLQRLKRSTLVVDVLSVKEFPRRLLLSRLPAEVDILCTHPMFGPDSGAGSWESLNFMYEVVRLGGVRGGALGRDRAPKDDESDETDDDDDASCPPLSALPPLPSPALLSQPLLTPQALLHPPDPSADASPPWPAASPQLPAADPAMTLSERTEAWGGGRRAARLAAFLHCFAAEGCRMVRMSCAEHDRAAASSQFITHTVGRMLGAMALTPTPIDTRGYQSLLSLVDNTTHDSFELYYGLFLYNGAAAAELAKLEQALAAVKRALLLQVHGTLHAQLLSHKPAGEP
ncbi:hypothetical protein H632_c790p2 [Helicosporidium sp. ATCC 50920]|nr:hypothetical protein H632_c790p2 [Helicosporidium sp. ATCC 50920]|eukprot:KDD75242.1 hypothetical protein H632_c790p2 [Helicosporidium sp. ATCC 50920]